MPIILPLDRHKGTTRLLIFAVYALLILGALTTVLPFMITLTTSLSTVVDAHRFAPVPRFLFSRTERFIRGLPVYFKDRPDDLYFRNRPAHWTAWTTIGNDRAHADSFVRPYLDVACDARQLALWRKIAADYAAFALDYDIHDTFCNYDFRDLAGFLRAEYERRLFAARPAEARRLSRAARREAALQLLCTDWEIPYRSFFDIAMDTEIFYPLHHVSWVDPRTAKARAFLQFKEAYRRLQFAPGARRQWTRYLRQAGVTNAAPWPVTPADGPLWEHFKSFSGQTRPLTPTVPYALKPQWLKYLDRTDVKTNLGLRAEQPFTVADYNRLFDVQYTQWQDLPFPVPAAAPPALQRLWDDFVAHYYPRRLMEIRVNAALIQEYQRFLRSRFRTIDNYNWLVNGTFRDFSQVILPPRVPRDNAAEVWLEFVGQIPREHIILHSADHAYQQFLLTRYGSLAAINAAYGWHLTQIEEAVLPLAEAYTVTFLNHEWRDLLHGMSASYRLVLDYLFIRGRAFLNTIILVLLTLAATLTVNPLAAYALSRFRLRWSEQILLFLMATMAFPAAVSAIPGFLLMRDLHLLNTYAALVLPGLANGLAIFILKGFFDGIPRELYEAATIDGASEWQIFRRITLPMTTPILAVNSLHAFIAAYGSWEWALLVCQRSDYWTLSVWLYQLGTTMGHMPWIMTAAFVIASIPTAVVFITCQKVILRGIVIPSMK